jgi:hypothetical protein
MLGLALTLGLIIPQTKSPQGETGINAITIGGTPVTIASNKITIGA